MKKFLICTFLLITIFFSACQSTETAEQKESDYELFDNQKISMYDENFKNNILTPVYIEGVLGKTFQMDSYIAIDIANDISPYILRLGNTTDTYTEELDTYSNKHAIAYGNYDGLCNVTGYGYVPVIDIDRIEILNSDVSFTKSDLSRLDIQKTETISPNTIKIIQSIHPQATIEEYYTTDKTTNKKYGPTLEIDIFAKTVKETISISEQILSIPDLLIFEDISINCNNQEKELYGIISFWLDSNNNIYYSTCILDLTENNEFQKEYNNNKFFSRTDNDYFGITD